MDDIFPLEYAQTNLTYNSDTGELRWLTDGTGFRTAGQLVNGRDKDGYLIVSVKGKQHRAHKVCWALFYGEYPTFIVHHDNKIRDDNRIKNLVASSNQHNSRNRKVHDHQPLGVYKHKASGKWCATYKTAVRWKHLGLYASMEEAANALKEGGYV